MAFVADASVTLAWIYGDEADARTDALMDRAGEEGVRMPAIWPFEIANSLVTGQRRNRQLPDSADRLIARLYRLKPTIEAAPDLETAIAIESLAKRHTLSAYDAAYLELARRLTLPLATSDRRLAAAAEAEGIAVL